MPKYRFEEIAYNSTEKKIPSEDDKHTYIGLEHLDSGTMTVTRWGSEVAPIGEKLVMRKGDVLFGKRRAYQKKVAIAPFDGIFSAHGMVLRPKEKVVTKEFFPLFISSDYFLNEAIRISVGSLSPTINWRDLKELEFSLPTIEEQSRISPLIWAAIRGKEAYKKMLESTDNLVKSQFIEMFGDPVENNKCWSNRSLSEVAPEFNPTIPNDDEYWWLNLDMIESYSGYITDKVMVTFDKIGNSTSPFDNTMVLYSKLRPYLNKVVIPDGYGYATTELVGMKPDEKVLKKRFLFNIFRSNAFMTYANSISAGGQMPRMPMKQLREFRCILPPLELQEQFILFDEQADKSKFVGEKFKFKINNLAGRNQNVY